MMENEIVGAAAGSPVKRRAATKVRARDAMVVIAKDSLPRRLTDDDRAIWKVEESTWA